MSSQDSPGPATSNISVRRGDPLVVVERVQKHYGDFHALKDIDLTVNRGEVVVVIGPSGSGKSTLCRTINRLEGIDSGTITVDGEDIHRRGLDVNRLRSRIGFVFQQFNLFPHLDVLHNCILAPRQVHGLGEPEAGRPVGVRVDV